MPGFKDKSPGMKKAINGSAKTLFGMSRTEVDRRKICVCCHNAIGPFDNPLSEREYVISGLCQACQDSVFGAGEG